MKIQCNTICWSYSCIFLISTQEDEEADERTRWLLRSRLSSILLLYSARHTGNGQGAAFYTNVLEIRMIWTLNIVNLFLTHAADASGYWLLLHLSPRDVLLVGFLLADDTNSWRRRSSRDGTILRFYWECLNIHISRTNTYEFRHLSPSRILEVDLAGKCGLMYVMPCFVQIRVFECVKVRGTPSLKRYVYNKTREIELVMSATMYQA